MGCSLEEEIASRFSSLLSAIRSAEERAGRPARSVSLIAVSKRQPDERIRAFLDCAVRVGEPALLGENYVQEWRDKRDALPRPTEVHLIGPLQSNKVRDAVALFDVIQSVHSDKVLKLISHEAERAGKTQRIFIQVNISKDQAKAGFLPEDAVRVAKEARTLSALTLEGLMTITRDYAHAEEARSDFRALRELRDMISPELGLSMGMSSDFEVAIEEGATHVRVGTALFGARE